MAKNIEALIRKKQLQRKKLVEQIRLIDVELDGLMAASFQKRL